MSEKDISRPIIVIALLTLSTVYYPIEVIQNYLPPFLVTAASANPLSLAAEALRQYTFVGAPVELAFLAKILLASIPFTVIGAFAYLGALRNFQVKGKL